MDDPLDKLIVRRLEPGVKFKQVFVLRDTDDQATVLRYVSRRTGKERTRIDLEIWNYNNGAAFSIERAELLIELLQSAVAEAKRITPTGSED